MRESMQTNVQKRAAGVSLPVFMSLLTLAASPARAEHDGYLHKDGRTLFPIGFYELPKDDTKLKAMADAGVNLVRCRSRADLDRVASVGMMGVIPLGVHSGATDKLRKHIQSVCDHPALAVWEGPDEVVWNFTAYSGLYRKAKVHKQSGEWWKQTSNALAYSRKRAAELMPKMREGIALVRKLDKRNRPFWINEAQRSDVKFVRQYLGWIDITGCDIYPISERNRNVVRVGVGTERWKQAGRGKPVYMVLQAFGWGELGDYYGHRKTVYPSFAESRFMAYDVIAHGARGILYWGSHYLKSEAFRRSIYALTHELSMLQTLLVGPEVEGSGVNLIEMREDPNQLGVCGTARAAGDELLVILVNEDETPHMGTEVVGLKAWEGKSLELLYGDETCVVRGGAIVTRMLPHEVKVFATSKKYESKRTEGRDYVQPS